MNVYVSMNVFFLYVRLLFSYSTSPDQLRLNWAMCVPRCKVNSRVCYRQLAKTGDLNRFHLTAFHHVQCSGEKWNSVSL